MTICTVSKLQSVLLQLGTYAKRQKMFAKKCAKCAKIWCQPDLRLTFSKVWSYARAQELGTGDICYDKLTLLEDQNIVPCHIIAKFCV